MDTCPVGHAVFHLSLSNIILNFPSYLWRKETFLLSMKEVLCLMVYISCKRGSNLRIVSINSFFLPQETPFPFLQ